MENLRVLIDGSQFRAGLGLGGVGLALVLGIVVGAGLVAPGVPGRKPRTRHDPTPTLRTTGTADGSGIEDSGNRPAGPVGVVGLVFACAVGLGLAGWFGAEGVEALPRSAIAGLALAALGATAAARLRPSVTGMALATVPGAALLAFGSDLPGEAWVPAAVFGAAVAGAALGGDFDRRARPAALVPLLWLVSVGGVYASVPDTEEARLLLGVALALAPAGLLAAVVRRRSVVRLGAGGSAAAVGCLCWVAAIGGAGRAGSVVGGLGSLGLFVVEPLGRLLAGGRSGVGSAEPSPNRSGAALLVVAHAAVVAWAARVAGFERSAANASLLLLSAVAAGLAVGAVRRRRPSTVSGSRPTPP